MNTTKLFCTLLIPVLFLCGGCNAQKVQSENKVVIGPCVTGEPKHPNYIVDGVRYNYNEYASLNISPDRVKRARAVTGNKALEAYGAFGENGVVVIVMKK